MLLAKPPRNIDKIGNVANTKYIKIFVLKSINTNSELRGINPKTTGTLIKIKIGARLNKNLSTPFGVIFSLHNNLKASAMVCRTPQKPTLFGPFLCVKYPNNFLSARTSAITIIKIATKIIKKGIT